MTKQISVLKSDILEAGELGSCVSMLMGLDFEFLVGDCVDPNSETKKAYKYQSHSVMEDYRTAITDVVLDVIHNPSVPFLDAWFDSEEGFLATLICQVSECGEWNNSLRTKGIQNENSFPFDIDVGLYVLTLDIDSRGDLSINTVGTPLFLRIPFKMIPDLMPVINKVGDFSFEPAASEPTGIWLSCEHSGDSINRPKSKLEIIKIDDSIYISDANKTVFGDSLLNEVYFPCNRIAVFSSALVKALGIMTNETKIK